MSSKLRTAVAIVGGAVTALAVPAAAQATARPAPPRPGLADPHARSIAPRAPRAGATAHSKANVPDVSCGGGHVTWQDNYDNRYLEIYHSGTANGNWADAYPGNGTCTQQWFAIASGSSPYFCNGGACEQPLYGMVNTNSDKCLAAATTNIGNTHVEQESCGYSTYNWEWAEVTKRNGWMLVETVRNGSHITNIGNYVAACEDTANHWVYTSHVSNASGASNCIWH